MPVEPTFSLNFDTTVPKKDGILRQGGDIKIVISWTNPDGTADGGVYPVTFKEGTKLSEAMEQVIKELPSKVVTIVRTPADGKSEVAQGITVTGSNGVKITGISVESHTPGIRIKVKFP